MIKTESEIILNFSAKRNVIICADISYGQHFRPLR